MPSHMVGFGMTIDLNSDFQVFVATLSGEADGEPLEAKRAVASTIINRVSQAGVHPHFGDGTIRGACLAHYQFSCWLPGPDLDRIMNLDLDHPYPVLVDCMNVANQAMQGTLVDPTSGATYYYDESIEAPTWTQGATYCEQIGRLKFYKDVK